MLLPYHALEQSVKAWQGCAAGAGKIVAPAAPGKGLARAAQRGRWTALNPVKGQVSFMRNLYAFVLLAATPWVLAAETVVPVHEEPRHRLVHEGPGLRVLDVEIAPGDTTLFHRHDAPIAYVYISPTPTKMQVLGQDWGSTSPSTAPAIGSVLFNETYAAAPVEHRVTNPGEVAFRLIAVLNRGPGQANGSDESLVGTDPIEASGRWFRSAHHTLTGQATWDWEGTSRPVVVVQVSAGAVVFQPGTGPSSNLQSPGNFIVLQPEDRAQFRNPGHELVTLAIVEVR